MRLDRTFRSQTTTHELAVTLGVAHSFILGRARDGVLPDVDLTPDFTTSRPHARIEIEESGNYWVEDSGSTHGTLLNGREIKGLGRQALNPGDTLRLGDTLLRVDCAFGRDSPPAAPMMEKSSDPLRIGGELDARSGVPALLRPATIVASKDSEAARRLALICELPLQFAAQSQLPELLQLIVQRLVETIPGATRGALVLKNDSPASVQEIAADGRESPFENSLSESSALVPHAFFPLDGPPVLSRTLARRAMDERSGFIWSRGEEESDIPLSGSIARYAIESGMYAPLLWQDEALGAVCVDNGGQFALAPFTSDDLRLMLMVAQYAAMAVANQKLQQDLKGAWTGALEALTSALASRDYDTQSHCYRTVELTVILARRMNIPEQQLPAMARGALLHDIGKIGISDNILFKPGALSPDERETMKGHARLGHEMLRHIPFFQDALSIVLHHHEQFNGNGYPLGLRERQIPHGARVFHVVDLYDALTQQRPYKTAWTHETAIAEIRRLSGTQCDPEVVAALAALEPEITSRIRNLKEFSPDVRELLGRQSGT